VEENGFSVNPEHQKWRICSPN